MKKFKIKIGYLIERKISLSSPLNKAYKKNGIDTIVAIDNNGSFKYIPNINDINTNNVDNNIVVFLPKVIVKVFLLSISSPFISGISVNKITGFCSLANKNHKTNKVQLC